MEKTRLILLIFVILGFIYIGLYNKSLVSKNKKIEPKIKNTLKAKKESVKKKKIIVARKDIKKDVPKKKTSYGNYTITSFTINMEEIFIRDYISLGNYGFVDERIYWGNYRIKFLRSSKKEVFLVGVNTHRIDSNEALSFLRKINLRPASLSDLVIFGAEYRELEKEGPIISLGSFFLSEYNTRLVPVLWGNESGRSLTLCLYSFKWIETAKFLAVR